MCDLLIILNIYLTDKCTKKIFPMVSLSFDDCNTLQKKLGQRHVYHCHITIHFNYTF